MVTIDKLVALTDALREYERYQTWGVYTKSKHALAVVEAWRAADYPEAGAEARQLFAIYNARGVIMTFSDEENELRQDLMARAAVRCADRLVEVAFPSPVEQALLEPVAPLTLVAEPPPTSPSVRPDGVDGDSEPPPPPLKNLVEGIEF